MSDLIERLQRLSMGLANEDEDTVLDAIAALKAREWRRVEDGLPNGNQYVIAFNGSVEGVFFDHSGASTGNWPDMWANDEGLPMRNVTHWMPLPAPPEDV